MNTPPVILTTNGRKDLILRRRIRTAAISPGGDPSLSLGMTATVKR